MIYLVGWVSDRTGICKEQAQWQAERGPEGIRSAVRVTVLTNLKFNVIVLSVISNCRLGFAIA